VAGAAAISVLTEPDFFKGDKKYLQEIARIMDIEVAGQKKEELNSP